MLFLQNLGKAVKVFLSITRAIKLLVSLITKPLMYPVKKMVNCLMPLWSLFTVAAKEFHNIRSAMLEFFCGVVSFLFDVFILPLKVLFTSIEFRRHNIKKATKGLEIQTEGIKSTETTTGIAIGKAIERL
ncbi:hypothetical protein L484_007040 [Morus notabilis]|uniref:Uncharacterized protein n=1 Tax=Morus notabilis TaxID=981085 RepID=W9RW31_9ROSA|nr:hypothetical protein L484_007040 [Morus notabilis]